jgi:single-stranded DNA-specific DHH superfamily exonuclease
MEGLTKKEYEKIKDELDYCNRPLIFFHDDPDGVSSFLQLYRYKMEGRGIIIKTTPNIDLKFIKKVKEYAPDKIFIVDIAQVEQDFIDSAGVPIIWIDHHGPYGRQNVSYFNPRKHNPLENPPVSYLISKVVNEPETEWVAMVGMVGDWYLPPDYKEFSKRYPLLLPEGIDKPEDAMFNTEIGTLTRIFSFMLKGTTNDAMKHVKVLTRIDRPEEILKQETPQGKFIYKRYEQIKEKYDLLLKLAKKRANKGGVIVFEYTDKDMSFTAEISNELLYLHPDKVIVIAREKSGEMKCSFRSSSLVLPPIIEKCLEGLSGRGGGHEHASGAVMKKEDFEIFLKRFKKEIEELTRKDNKENDKSV